MQKQDGQKSCAIICTKQRGIQEPDVQEPMFCHLSSFIQKCNKTEMQQK